MQQMPVNIEVTFEVSGEINGIYKYEMDFLKTFIWTGEKRSPQPCGRHRYWKINKRVDYDGNTLA